ncbi:imelysin family protein, partial [Arthrospira platensis SPKY1]|nr:imelysin family protein [Arthrospira platensis SPKY1]
MTHDDPGFDRALMLKNYAENLIVPAYRDVQASVDALVSALETFSADITLQNLENAQNAWINAYGEWMYANAFNVGPAAEEGLNKRSEEHT